MGRIVASLVIAGVLAIGGATATTIADNHRDDRREGAQGRRGCSDATLRGVYGLQWIGTRPARVPPGTPAVIETFTGIATRSFDGDGSFVQVSNVKGAVTGLEPENIESMGTYQVNEDCTGTASSQFVPGGPIVLQRFVIVDDGNEVLASVMEPLQIFNAGVMRRIHNR